MFVSSVSIKLFINVTVLGTEDIDAKYLAGDFDISLNSNEMSLVAHEISNEGHGLPVFQFMAKNQAWANWRHCELSVKETHLSWCFLEMLGRGSV